MSSRERAFILMFSGIADEVGEIVGDEYSNERYREIVYKCKPDIYFGNEEWSEGRLKEGEYRANSVGARFVVLPEFSGFHTSEFESILF